MDAIGTERNQSLAATPDTCSDCVLLPCYTKTDRDAKISNSLRDMQASDESSSSSGHYDLEREAWLKACELSRQLGLCATTDGDAASLNGSS